MQLARIKSWGRRLFVVVIATVLVIIILRVAQAGSLSPTASPAASLVTLEDIFNPLASSSFDSSSFASSSDGNALQIGRCIIYKMHGGNC